MAEDHTAGRPERRPLPSIPRKIRRSIRRMILRTNRQKNLQKNLQRNQSGRTILPKTLRGNRSYRKNLPSFRRNFPPNSLPSFPRDGASRMRGSRGR
jgi:hypothetical protein